MYLKIKKIHIENYGKHFDLCCFNFYAMCDYLVIILQHFDEDGEKNSSFVKVVCFLAYHFFHTISWRIYITQNEATAHMGVCRN